MVLNKDMLNSFPDVMLNKSEVIHEFSMSTKSLLYHVFVIAKVLNSTKYCMKRDRLYFW